MEDRYLKDSFFDLLPRVDEGISRRETEYSPQLIEKTVMKQAFCIGDLPVLLAAKEKEHISILLDRARELTKLRFGKKITLYAPLYVSNYCGNQCTYCGFNAAEKRKRIRLNQEEILLECDYLKDKDLRHVLLVSGEDGKADVGYFEETITNLTGDFDFIGIEIQPLTTEEYGRLYRAGLDGVTIYQETYDRSRYGGYHPKGNKSDFRFRLETPERIASAGIPNISIGALLGLAPWQDEVTRGAYHLEYLQNKYWRSHFGFSFPRINTDNLGFKTPFPVGDVDFVKIIASLRLIFPDTPFYLSTRENAHMRDNLIHYGITHMSAESRTEPGGYRVYPGELKQFATDDNRTVEEIIAALKGQEVRPALKDWDKGYRYECCN